MRATEISTLQAYLRWHLIDSTASALSEPIVRADFEFSRKLTGAGALSANWERCVQLTNFSLG